MTNSLYWCSCLWNTKGQPQYLQFTSVHGILKEPLIPFLPIREISDSGLLCCDKEHSLCQYHRSDETRCLLLYLISKEWKLPLTKSGILYLSVYIS
jgi:hypothetical protein